MVLLEVLQVFVSGDVVMFICIFGIGKKIVECMVVELCDKVGEMVEEQGVEWFVVDGVFSGLQSDLVLVFVNFGYCENFVECVVQKVVKEFGDNVLFQDLLKCVLQSLLWV